ncbi:unnamed protein product [marine sediment metagenome]|uniref:Uncharacterized protein n=1 Tax=marine sediment metagenome TaxID=412755 RepID=X0RYE8_9ZZZZ
MKAALNRLEVAAEKRELLVKELQNDRKALRAKMKRMKGA